MQDGLPSLVSVLEESKYSLRTIFLLERNGPRPLVWLTRHIPSSPVTVVRCLGLLEEHGLVARDPGSVGNRSRLYRLTPTGERMMGRPPKEWYELEAYGRWKR